MNSNSIVVCGAGISGLLIASELSKSVEVTVLERSSEAACSNKFWLTSKNALDQNVEFDDCIDSEWQSMDFIANNRQLFTVYGDYLLWDTKKTSKKAQGYN